VIGDVATEVRTGRPHEGLMAAAAACGADLMVVGRHGTSLLARAWIGGTAQKVIGLAEGPVLVHIAGTS
jgi:nucleotide-binding universal stress UspA family protein